MSIETIYQMRSINSKDLISLIDDYQREKKDKQIAKIVSEWDERVSNEPKVSYRDGHYFVFDGQHTIAARVFMNGGEDLMILCKVYYGLCEEEEALLFAKQNGVSTRPTPGIRMRAWIFGKDTEAIAFRNATARVGLMLEFRNARSPYHLFCINTALGEDRHVGEKNYIDALRIIVETWHGSPDSLRYEIIKAVTRFCSIYHGQFDRTRLIKNLRPIDPNAICNRINADFVLPVSKKYVNQIFLIYNMADKRRQLPMKFCFVFGTNDKKPGLAEIARPGIKNRFSRSTRDCNQPM